MRRRNKLLLPSKEWRERVGKGVSADAEEDVLREERRGLMLMLTLSKVMKSEEASKWSP